MRGRGGGDIGFEDAVDGEKGDVVDVRGQHARGRGVAPAGTGEEGEEGGAERGREGEEGEGEEGVEAEDVEEVGGCLEGFAGRLRWALGGRRRG